MGYSEELHRNVMLLQRNEVNVNIQIIQIRQKVENSKGNSLMYSGL